MGFQGEGGMEAGRLCQTCRLRPPPSAFWFLFHAEKELAPQGETLPRCRGGETPLLKIKTKTAPGPTLWSEGGVIQNKYKYKSPQARGWLLRYTSLIF